MLSLRVSCRAGPHLRTSSLRLPASSLLRVVLVQLLSTRDLVFPRFLPPVWVPFVTWVLKLVLRHRSSHSTPVKPSTLRLRAVQTLLRLLRSSVATFCPTVTLSMTLTSRLTSTSLSPTSTVHSRLTLPRLFRSLRMR